jgi:hypothetical protein
VGQNGPERERRERKGWKVGGREGRMRKEGELRTKDEIRL